MIVCFIGIKLTQFKLINTIHTMISANSKPKDDLVSCSMFLMNHYASIRQIVQVIFDEQYTIVVPSFKFDVLDIMISLEKYKCFALFCYPKILLNMVTHPDRKKYDFSNLKLIFSGGQLAPLDLILKTKTELNVQLFFVAYSSTEYNNCNSSD